jgi:xylulokinase
VEGSTFALRFGFEELSQLGVSAEEIVLIGGGANSDAWRQIVADICNAPVTVLKNSEGAAFGAALQAVAMLDGEGGQFSDLLSQHLERDAERCCEPQPSAVEFYNDTYNDYQRAVEKVAALYS